MGLSNKKARKPVIFGRKKVAKKQDIEQDDTLDMLLHYAKAGMEYAEQSLEDAPDLFSAEERDAFQQNKNMLEQAPYLIDNYKSKMDEYDALHKKMKGILQRCEEIVAVGDTKARNEIKEVLEDEQVFTYTEDGDIVLKKDTK